MENTKIQQIMIKYLDGIKWIRNDDRLVDTIMLYQLFDSDDGSSTPHFAHICNNLYINDIFIEKIMSLFSITDVKSLFKFLKSWFISLTNKEVNNVYFFNKGITNFE